MKKVNPISRNAIFKVVLAVCSFVFYRGIKLCAKPATKTLRKDKRPPVLYLRPFSSDGEQFEPLLSRLVHSIGPFVAAGKPGEALTTIGADRVYINPASWKTKVADLIKNSRLVILRMGESEGLLWELEQVFALLKPHQILLFFPEGDIAYRPFYKTFTPFLQEYAVQLPESIGNARFIRFNSAGIPQRLELQDVASPKRNRYSSIFLLKEMLEPVLLDFKVKKMVPVRP